MEKHDIVVIGAGPAGLRAAQVSAEAGNDVLILEKNRVIGPTICAGGLTIRDMDIIPKNIVDAEFNYFILHTAKRTYNVDLGSHPLFTVDREKLGQWMAKETQKAGAEIRTVHRVTGIEGNTILVNGKEIGYDFLVGADGSNSVVRKSLNIPVKKTLIGVQYRSNTLKRDLEVFVDDFKKCIKYDWIFPHRDFTSIGMGGWTKNAAMLRHELDGLCDKLSIAKTKFEAAHINIDYKGFAFGNRFLAGDAAGFASGLTGEGIYQAILSGEEVARGITKENYGYPGIKNLLKMKNNHENLLRVLRLHRYIPAVVFNDIIPFLLKNRDLCRKFNNRYNLI